MRNEEGVLRAVDEAGGAALSRHRADDDVYSALPAPGELSATMFIEIADNDDIKPVLDRFMGIDTGRHVWFQVGRELVVPGSFEAGHSDEE